MRRRVALLRGGKRAKVKGSGDIIPVDIWIFN